VIGHHRGYPFYTIGQRRGLGAATGEPIYVTSIDPVHNRIHTGKKTNLLSRELTARAMNWIGIEPPTEPFEATARIRYRDTPTPCRVTPLEDGSATNLIPLPPKAPSPQDRPLSYTAATKCSEGDSLRKQPTDREKTMLKRQQRSLTSLELSPEGNGKNNLIVMLHGYGSNEKDLIQLAPRTPRRMPLHKPPRPAAARS